MLLLYGLPVLRVPVRKVGRAVVNWGPLDQAVECLGLMNGKQIKSLSLR